MSLKISHNFDAGAIEPVFVELAADIQLRLRPDSHADFKQWFYFRLQGSKNEVVTIRILDAGTATYPKGWENYQAVASYDRQNWFRVPTSFDGMELKIDCVPTRDSIYFAYFEPYSWERHLGILARAEESALTRLVDLGSTCDGRDINMLVMGNSLAAKKIWIIARQHPGETMAEWLVEGMLDALLDRSNPVARLILAHAVFYIVPNMNPDGSVRGNLRTNAKGINLNREWMAPSLEQSPEVFFVRQKILETGCDLFLDIHGDEALPYVFVAGSEMLTGFSEQQHREQQTFVQSLLAASPDFQTRVGYPVGKYHDDVLKLASKYIGHTFKCVSLTLELPFKDNADLPDSIVGWNGARSKQLGAALLQPILTSLKNERA